MKKREPEKVSVAVAKFGIIVNICEKLFQSVGI